MLITMLLIWLVTLAFTIPAGLVGLLLAPLMARGSWLIEFLYPLPIARWGHLLILRWSQPKIPLDDTAANYHSRTLEQRVEVVTGRVFVHPIPQLLDNLGYLVVCLPPTPQQPTTVTSTGENMPQIRLSIQTQQEPDATSLPTPPVVAFLVDCGDANTVHEQVQLIRETHYPQYPHIRLQMVLSTHKHHDHTAGNEPLKAHAKMGQYLYSIVGGAVEKVPGCNMPVSDGDRVKLPLIGKNDMNDLVHVEVVAVPAHTRGSVVYLLRPNKSQQKNASEPLPCFAFTGDTMFSGGGGVPFEAGSDGEIDQGAYQNNAHGAIRAGVGSHAVERCFAEILFRGVPDAANYHDHEMIQNQFLVFPGHEYTTELLARQFGSPSAGGSDANKWKNFPPHMFFETVSELYVALHRRSLPQMTGKVLAAAPSSLRKELSINPHLRSLARRAELVVQSIRLWDAYFCRPKGPRDEEAAVMRIRHDGVKLNSTSALSTTRRRTSTKTKANEDSWNVDSHDVAKTVFTTVYTSDLDALITDLASGKLAPEDAVSELEGMKAKLKEPVIRRRPIPGTLPSERAVFKGLVGFALLGSRPSAMTLSDSETMKLPPPIVRDTSCIIVSKKRLITVLGHLGYFADNDGPYLLAMIHSLWQEANDYSLGNKDGASLSSDDVKYNVVGKLEDGNDTTSSRNEDEESDDTLDLIQLGTLKWILYGFPATQPSWWSSFCMPCGATAADKALEQRQDQKAQEEHPVQVSSMTRRHGELVRHDVITCMLCRGATGCVEAEEEQQQQQVLRHADNVPSDEEEEGEEQTVASSYHPSSSPQSIASDSPRSQANNLLLQPADDVSVVCGSDDDASAVEVAALPNLLGGDHHYLEEKVRL